MRTSERGRRWGLEGWRALQTYSRKKLGPAPGPLFRALQLPALGERAFGIRAAASDQGRGEHPLCAEFVGGAGSGGGGACYLDSIKLPSVTLLR